MVQWGRIADVNYNRLNESLKFIEDIIRFSLENKTLLHDIRKIRAQFFEVKKQVPRASVISLRASSRDLGRSARFDRTTRRTTNDLVMANMSRAKESARILEEIFRKYMPRASKLMKDIRFRLYDLELALYAAYSRSFDPALYAIFDETYILPSRFERDVKTMIRSGVTAVQLRIKRRSDRFFSHYAKKLMRLLDQTKITCIINNRIDIALASNTHGIHLGQQDMPVRTARKLFGDHRIIGVSAHTIIQAKTAQSEGADYLGVGAVFPTETKHERRVIGLKKLHAICNAVSIPVVAIGGINRDNFRSAILAGAAGVAVCSFLFKGSLQKNIRSLTGKRR